MRARATNATEPPKGLVVLAFAAIYILWGSSYLAIRYTVETLPPFMMAGVRAFAAGVILFILVGRRRIGTLTPAHWRSAAITGGLFFLGCHGLLFRVERSTDSGIAALVLATIPGWIMVLSCIFVRPIPRAHTVLGLLLSFGGVAALICFSSAAERLAPTSTAVLVLLISAMAWGCGSVYSRSAQLPAHIGTATAMQLLCGGALAILTGVAIGEAGQVALADVTLRSSLSLAYLIVFGSLVSFSAYAWLLRTASPTAVGTYAFVNPVVAVLLGWLFAGEALNIRTAIAGAAIVSGVVLVHGGSRRTGRQRAGTRTEPTLLSGASR